MLLKKKKVKKPSRSKLVKELDRVFSLYIRNKYAKDGYVRCVTCGVVKPIKEMQNGHFVSRGKYATRWLDENCAPQCPGCNIFLQGNYPRYAEFIINTYGPDKISELVRLGNTILKISNAELEEKIAHYKLLLSTK